MKSDSDPKSIEPNRGRQQAREEAQAKILAAAKALFAEKGFAAVSLVEIAERAGCTKGLVHHYFGSKRELWREVIEDYARSGNERELAAGDLSDDVQGILDRLRGSFRFFQNNGDYLRIARWAELQADHGMPESLEKVMRQSTAHLRRAQEAGEMRADIDPEHLHLMTYCMMTGWFQTKRFFCPAWGRDKEDPEADDAFMNDMLTFVRGGIEAVASRREKASGE